MYFLFFQPYIRINSCCDNYTTTLLKNQAFTKQSGKMRHGSSKQKRRSVEREEFKFGESAIRRSDTTNDAGYRLRRYADNQAKRVCACTSKRAKIAPPPLSRARKRARSGTATAVWRQGVTLWVLARSASAKQKDTHKECLFSGICYSSGGRDE